MQVKGLTTAASIWLTAAVGMTVGLGRGATAVPPRSRTRDLGRVAQGRIERREAPKPERVPV